MYINKILILLTVDLAILIFKTLYGAQTLLSGYLNEPLKERKYFNKYFILAIIYYFSALLKYSLIEVAFTSGSQIVRCRIVEILLASAAVGVGLYIPCLVVALRVGDSKHAQETIDYNPRLSKSILK